MSREQRNRGSRKTKEGEFYPEVDAWEAWKLENRPTLQASRGIKRLEADSYLETIVDLVKENQVVIVVGAAGSGKSTRIPPRLFDTGYKVLVTEPRIVAVEQLAARVAEERSERLGIDIGYANGERVCFDKNVTKLLYATDGYSVIKEMILAEGFIPEVAVIDEVGTWSEQIEMLVGWVRECVRDNYDIKFVLMASSLNAEFVSKSINNAPIVEIPSKRFTVENLPPKELLIDDLKEELELGRNVLVFCDSRRQVYSQIKNARDAQLNAELIPLHASMPQEAVDLAMRSYSRPKIIFATNVAQEAITIEDIDTVIDLGFEFRPEMINGESTLVRRPISQSDLTNRKGRVGRTKNGYYKDRCPIPPEERPFYNNPEIQSIDLDYIMLKFASMNVDPLTYPFIHPPHEWQINKAHNNLRDIGCIDEDGLITECGRFVSRLPCSPAAGVMLWHAKQHNVVEYVIPIAAIFNNRNFVRTASENLEQMIKGKHTSSELITLSKLYLQIIKQPQDYSQLYNLGIACSELAKVKRNISRIEKALNITSKEISDSSPHINEILSSIRSGFTTDQIFYCDSFLRGITLGKSSRISHSSFLPLEYGKFYLGKRFSIEDPKGSVISFIEYAHEIDLDFVISNMDQFKILPHGAPYYSASIDRVIQDAEISVGGVITNRIVLELESKKESSDILAKWLAIKSNHGIRKYEANSDLHQILSSNLSNIKRINRSNNIVIPDECLYEVFKKKINGASSIKELESMEAIEISGSESEILEIINHQAQSQQIIKKQRALFFAWRSEQHKNNNSISRPSEFPPIREFILKFDESPESPLTVFEVLTYDEVKNAYILNWYISSDQASTSHSRAKIIYDSRK